MENSLHITEPVALVRPRGAHRFEAFSPKLARRLTLYRRALLEQWFLLEADPAVTTFCERPGYVHVEGLQRLADFWVRYADRQELVILDDSHADEKMPKPHRALDGAALPIRSVSPADLAAARCGSTTGSVCFRALWPTGVLFHRPCHERSSAS